jgi:hypothetical protein
MDVMANGMGDVLVFVQDGPRAFTYHGRYGIGEETRPPHYADFDSDGIGDLLAVVDRLPPGMSTGGIAFVPGLAGSATAVESIGPSLGIPASFALSAPRPNPARDRATFVLSLPEPERVTVALYDPLGRRVAVLRDGSFEAGSHVIELDGAGLPSGVYSMKAIGETFTATRRAVLLR